MLKLLQDRITHNKVKQVCQTFDSLIYLIVFYNFGSLKLCYFYLKGLELTVKIRAAQIWSVFQLFLLFCCCLVDLGEFTVLLSMLNIISFFFPTKQTKTVEHNKREG